MFKNPNGRTFKAHLFRTLDGLVLTEPRESVLRLKWLFNIKFLSNVLIPLSMNIHDMRPTIVVYNTCVCWALGWACMYNLECISFLRTKDTHISFLFLFTFIDSHHLCTIRGEKSIFLFDSLNGWSFDRHLMVVYSFCLVFLYTKQWIWLNVIVTPFRICPILCIFSLYSKMTICFHAIFHFCP